MSISANMHDVTDMIPFSVNGAEWLQVEGPRGNYIAIFMPLTLATALAEVFKAHQAGEAAALRARQMNAELPADQRDVLLAKGMVA